MYRQYEDPRALTERLHRAEELLKKHPDNYDLYEDVQELKERVNFAWQDEYEEEF